jgi:hypothetical protein
LPVDPERVLRPNRPGLARALAVALDLRETDARRLSNEPTSRWAGRLPASMNPWVLWANLATRGVIPKSWACASDRFFERVPLFRHFAELNVPRCALPHCDPHPPTPIACISIAADVDGIVATETNVRFYYRARADRIVWRVVAGQTAGAIRGGHVAAIRNGRKHLPFEVRLLSLGYALYCPMDDSTVLIAPSL